MAGAHLWFLEHMRASGCSATAPKHLLSSVAHDSRNRLIRGTKTDIWRLMADAVDLEADLGDLVISHPGAFAGARMTTISSRTPHSHLSAPQSGSNALVSGKSAGSGCGLQETSRRRRLLHLSRAPSALPSASKCEIGGRAGSRATLQGPRALPTAGRHVDNRHWWPGKSVPLRCPAGGREALRAVPLAGHQRGQRISALIAASGIFDRQAA